VILSGLSGLGVLGRCVEVVGCVWVCLGVFLDWNAVNFELFWLLNGMLNGVLNGF
jgi:hypothetical protein